MAFVVAFICGSISWSMVSYTCSSASWSTMTFICGRVSWVMGLQGGHLRSHLVGMAASAPDVVFNCTCAAFFS